MEISVGSDPWFFLYTVNIDLRKKVITRELLGFKRSLLYEKLSRNQEVLEFAIYFIIRRHRDDETTRRPDTPKKLHLLVYFFLFSRYPHTEGLNRRRYTKRYKKWKKCSAGVAPCSADGRYKGVCSAFEKVGRYTRRYTDTKTADMMNARNSLYNI